MRCEARSSRRSIARTSVAVALGAAMLMVAALRAAEEEGPRAGLPISAPVKLLAAPNAGPEQPSEEMVPQQQQRPQPTLPSGKLPQYQVSLNRDTAPSAEQLQNPNVTFVLALPSSQPILLRCSITIDGRPFLMARENRIEQILAAASQPDTEPAPESTQAEDVDESPEQDAEEASVAEPTAGPYAPAASAAEIVRRYVAATGREASADEVRWLLASRVDGPVLLMLNDNFQRFRANQRPAFHVLDRDRDNVISADELQQAVRSFQECDLNRDGIVDVTEIAASAKDPRRESIDASTAGKLLYRIDDAAADGLAHAEVPIPRRFDQNGNGRLDPDELPALQTAAPDLRLVVAFETADPGRSTIAVTAVGDALESAVAQARVDGNTITLPIGGAWLALSAVQADGSDQISIGAVNDGYPLLPALDPNDDGRFTVRELRELEDRLREFDRNRDGQLTVDEAQAPIRVCFGLGPLVHRELAGIRSVNPRPSTPAAPGPAWFVRMDRNKDNDLTREEFLGTDDQFQAVDADRDGLISGQEAAEFDSRTSAPQSTSSSSNEGGS